MREPELTPFACDPCAFTPQARQRHFNELDPALRARLKNVRELSDGFEFEFPSDAATGELAAEWVDGERLCCPFLAFELRIEQETSSLWLRVTGREGAKEFIQAEFAHYWIGNC